MRDERQPDQIPATALYRSANLPTRQALARYYAAGSGCDVSDFDYYLVLAMFKGGCAQAAAGILSAETGAMFSKLVLAKFEESAALIRLAG